WLVHATEPNFVESASTTVIVNGPQVTALTLQLGIGASVSGTVKDTNGTVVPNADLVFTSSTGTTVSTTTNANGHYTADGLPTGQDLAVQVVAPGFAPQDSVVTALEAGEQRVGVDSTLNPAQSITGYVVDSNNNAISGAAVVLSPVLGETAATFTTDVN